jgi:hypothetical protein
VVLWYQKFRIEVMLKMFGLLPQLKNNVSLSIKPSSNLPTYSFGNEAPHVVCVSSVSMVLLVNYRRGVD